MYLSGIVPALVFSSVPLPAAAIPLKGFLYGNINFFLECLPILALQYLLSLHFKNFLVPVGAGFAVWVLGLGMTTWEYSYLFPYNQGIIDFLKSSGNLKREVSVNLPLIAVLYFVVFTIASYVLYVTKKEKG
jgi:hypothetical protein